MKFHNADEIKLNDNFIYNWHSIENNDLPDPGIPVLAGYMEYLAPGWKESKTTVAIYIDNNWIDCLNISNHITPLYWAELPEVFIKDIKLEEIK